MILALISFLLKMAASVVLAMIGNPTLTYVLRRRSFNPIRIDRDTLLSKLTS